MISSCRVSAKITVTHVALLEIANEHVREEGTSLVRVANILECFCCVVSCLRARCFFNYVDERRTA